MWKNKATIFSFLSHLFWVGVFFCIGYKQRTQYQPIFRETTESFKISSVMLDSSYTMLDTANLNFCKHYRDLRKPLRLGFRRIDSVALSFINYLDFVETNVQNNPIYFQKQQQQDLENKTTQFYERLLSAYENVLLDSMVKKRQYFTDERIKERIKYLAMEIAFSWEKKEKKNNIVYLISEKKWALMNQSVLISTLNWLKFNAKNAKNSAKWKLEGELCGCFCDDFFHSYPVFSNYKSYIKANEEQKVTIGCGGLGFLYDFQQIYLPVTFSVNNQPINFERFYIAKFTEATTEIGKKTLYLKAAIIDPQTKKERIAESTFEYTVAEKPLIIRTPLQTILYKGIQQPIYFRGLDETILKVSSTGGKITAKKGDYFITPYAEDSLEVILETKEETRIFVFKVKPLPYPIATLSNKISDGMVSIASFQELSQQALGLIFKNLEGKVSAKITNFTLTKVSGSADIIETSNTGNKLCATAQNLVQTAKKGDIFVYENITVQIAGEATERVLAPLIFKVE